MEGSHYRNSSCAGRAVLIGLTLSIRLIAKGELKFDSLPSNAPNVLDIDSLALQNPSSNNVLSTTLP